MYDRYIVVREVSTISSGLLKERNDSITRFHRDHRISSFIRCGSRAEVEDAVFAGDQTLTLI